MPTQTPIPYIKWVVGDKVSSLTEERVRKGVALMHEYAASLGMPEIEEEVTVYIYRDIDKLVGVYMSVTGRGPTRDYILKTSWKKGNRGGIVVSSRGDKDVVFINASNSRTREGTIGIAAHELNHVQTRKLSSPSFRGSSNSVPRDGPVWLNEGTAEFLAWQALSEGGVHPYETRRESSQARLSMSSPI